MKNNRYIKTIAFIVLVPVLTGVLIFFTAMAAIGLEHLFVTWNIDNPHVDNHFEEWKSVHVEGYNNFLIPNKWSVVENDKVLFMVN